MGATAATSPSRANTRRGHRRHSCHQRRCVSVSLLAHLSAPRCRHHQRTAPLPACTQRGTEWLKRHCTSRRVHLHTRTKNRSTSRVNDYRVPFSRRSFSAATSSTTICMEMSATRTPPTACCICHCLSATSSWRSSRSRWCWSRSSFRSPAASRNTARSRAGRFHSGSTSPSPA